MHSNLKESAPLFIGIDVAYAKRKVLPIVVAREGEERLELISRHDLPRPPKGRGNWAIVHEPDGLADFAHCVMGWLDEVGKGHGGIRRIALDAPRREAPATGARACEEAMKHDGVSFIATPSDLESVRTAARRSLDEGRPVARMAEANRLWMLVGVELYSVLASSYQLIEVYPYAAFRRLGVGDRGKRDAEGRERRLAALAQFMGWDRPSELRNHVYAAAYGPLHDKIDAAISAAMAWRSDDSDAYCDPVRPDPHDMIAMPPRPDESLGNPSKLPSPTTDRSCGSAAGSAGRRLCFPPPGQGISLP